MEILEINISETKSETVKIQDIANITGTTFVYKISGAPNKYIAEPSSYINNSVPIQALDFVEEQIIFSIRRFEWFKLNADIRNHVIVYAHDYKNQILYRNVYYTSHSNGSFWRYCTKDSGSHYEKGYNYVVTTFINANLQNFLFENEPKHNRIQLSVTHIPDDCTPKNSIVDKVIKNRIHRKIKNEDEDEDEDKNDSLNVISENPVFLLLDKVFPSEGGIFDTVSIFDHSSQYDKYLSRFFDIWKRMTLAPITSESDHHEKNYNIALCKSLYDALYSYGVAINSPSEGRRAFFKKVYAAMNKYVQSEFTKISGSTKIISTTPRVININDKKFHLRMMTTNILWNKVPSRSYIVDWMSIEFMNAGITINRKIILHIRPEYSRITIYGLNDRYVSAGTFVNKFFEYQIQAENLSRLAGEEGMTYTDTSDIVNVDWL